MVHDLISPIVSGNRDEYILVQFYGTIKNYTEVLLLGLYESIDSKRITMDDINAHLPFIKVIEDIFNSKNKKAVYSIATHIPALEALNLLSGNKETTHSKFVDDNILNMGMGAFNLSTQTIMDAAVHKLVKEPFVKRIAFFDIVDTNNTRLLEYENRYIFNQFKEKSREKIIGYYPENHNINIIHKESGIIPSNSLEYIILNSPEITTIVLDDVKLAYETIKKIGETSPKYLYKKYFYIAASPNIKISSDKPTYNYFMELQNVFEKYGCDVEYFDNYGIVLK